MQGKQGSIMERLASFIKRKTSQQYKFDLQFAAKKWDGLKGIAELGRYSIIAGYVKYFAKSARILDLGCGEGVLLERLAASDYSLYTGVDFSTVAINNAQALATNKAMFIVGDLNKLNIIGTYDVIVYNESIYYLSDPVKAIQALFPQLNPDGIFIFSIVDKHGKEQTDLWVKLESVLVLQERTKVTNLAGNSWTIQVYKPLK